MRCLLIADFVLNWKTKDQRARLGRMFDHRKMSQAVLKIQGTTLSPVEVYLKKVIDAFGQLQKDRHSADYNVARIWSRTDVIKTLAIADEAFKAWRTVRKETMAQDHLMTMFGARRMLLESLLYFRPRIIPAFFQRRGGSAFPAFGWIDERSALPLECRG